MLLLFLVPEVVTLVNVHCSVLSSVSVCVCLCTHVAWMRKCVCVWGGGGGGVHTHIWNAPRA